MSSEKQSEVPHVPIENYGHEHQAKKKKARKKEEAFAKEEERLKFEASKDFREALEQNAIEADIEIKEEVTYDPNE
jgi:hypothetical protein